MTLFPHVYIYTRLTMYTDHTHGPCKVCTEPNLARERGAGDGDGELAWFSAQARRPGAAGKTRQKEGRMDHPPLYCSCI